MLRSPRSTWKQNKDKQDRQQIKGKRTSLCDAAAHSLTASSSAPSASNSGGLSSTEWRAPRPPNSRAHSLGGLGQSAFLCPGSPQLKHNPSLAALAGRCCSPSPAAGASRFPCTKTQMNCRNEPRADNPPCHRLSFPCLSPRPPDPCPARGFLPNKTRPCGLVSYKRCTTVLAIAWF